MATSFSTQSKTKIQQIASPKIKLPAQSPPQSSAQNITTSSVINNFQRAPVGKIHNRESVNNQSQSPEDSNSTRGGGIIQKIQMKNLAFIPGKGQSPIASSSKQAQLCNLTNLNQGNSDAAQQQNQTKISPQRILSNNGSKMVIPANQIKLVKKDGTSPSPEARSHTMKQISPSTQNLQNQNINPNTGTQNRVSQKITRVTGNKLISQQQTSDDETNVNSDNEDQVQNLNFLKSDSSQNNFNRPKLNSNKSQLTHQSSFVDPQLNLQKTQRGNGATGSQVSESQKIKVISQNKIRQSPSPPQSLKGTQQQSPSVTNLQAQIKAQQQIQQQKSSQPQLASDFIKGMITQNRTVNTNNQVGTQQKKTLSSIQNCLNLKKGAIGNTSPQGQQNNNLFKDKKKITIQKEVQDTNQMQQILSENSPLRPEDTSINGNPKQNTSQITTIKISHIRNYSPPPNFNQAGPTNLVDVNSNRESQKTSALQKPQDNTSNPTDTSIQNESQAQVNQEGQSVFQFPFQRRARSLSLPKQEIIQNKMKQGQNGTTAAQPDTNNADKTSQSPKRQAENQDQKRKGPVVANVNFVIPSNGVFGQKDEEAVFERNKEVEEWLMGSGESDATAGSSNSNNVKPTPSIVEKMGPVFSQRSQGKQNELSKPVQPSKKQNDEDDSSSVEDEEDWMFKTFDKIKGGAKGQKQANTTRVVPNQNNPGRSRVCEIQDFEDDFEESPFDMAPEMKKQFIKPQNNDQFDHLISECNDLSQYIDKIDEFMQKIN